MVLLVVGGGIESLPGIEIAHKMGLRVLVSDQNPDAPGCKAADDVLVASTYDPQATEDAAYEYATTVDRVNGVISFGSDVPITVAQVATGLGLETIGPYAAEMCANKELQRNALHESGINVPLSLRFSNDRYFAKKCRELQGAGVQLVVKPPDSRGARGVIRLIRHFGKRSQLHISIWNAFHLAMKYTNRKYVLLEEWLDGPQYSTEGFVVHGVYHGVAYADRNYDNMYSKMFLPYVIENGGSQPAAITDEQRVAIDNELQKAAIALRLRDCVLKGDVVWHDDKPYIVEVAPRLSGGYMSSDHTPLSTGVPFIELAILQALGQGVNMSRLKPQWNRGAAIRYLFPVIGKVTNISIPDPLPGWVHRLHINVKVGDLVKFCSDHPSRAGLVVTTGDTAKEAIERADRMALLCHIATAMKSKGQTKSHGDLDGVQWDVTEEGIK